MRKILFIGKSGSGKSTAARALLRGDGRPIVIVNDRSTAPLPPGETRISWTEAVKAKNCNLIVEDLIRITKSELDTLQLILNYNAHHEGLPNVILIAHAATSQGIFPVFQNLTHVCFMTSRSTVASLDAVLEAFRLSKDVRKEKMAPFLADVEDKTRPPHGYWVFDVESGALERQPGTLAAGEPASAAAGASAAGGTSAGGKEALLAPYRKTAEKYLALFNSDPKKAMAICDYLLDKVPLSSLDPGDLTFTLRQKKTGQVVRVSLLDYIDAVTSQIALSRDVLALHDYLRRHNAALPRCFIANGHRRFAAADPLGNVGGRGST